MLIEFIALVHELFYLLSTFYNYYKHTGIILERTTAAVIEKCLNPPEEMDKSEVERRAAEQVASTES